MGRDDSGRGVLIVYGDMPKTADHKVPYQFIAERKIYDEIPGGFHGQKAKKTFKGEQEVMKELSYLVRGQEKRKILFLQGDGEIDISDTDVAQRRDPRDEMSTLGAAQLVEKLKKDNYEVQAVTFNKDFLKEAKDKERKKEVEYLGDKGAGKKAELPNPKEIYAVVIAGASNPIPPEGLAAIERYMDDGGRLLVMLDVVFNKDQPKIDFNKLKMRHSGIESLLGKYGIRPTDEFGLAQFVPRYKLNPPYTIWATPSPNSENVVAKGFTGQIFQFRFTRIIRPSTDIKGPFRAEPILIAVPRGLVNPRAVPAFIAETDPKAIENPFQWFDDIEDRGELQKRITEELPIVVGVTEAGEAKKPRMVVFGDTEFISNLDMMMGARTDAYGLFVSSLEWMAERPGIIGTEAKASESVEMPALVALNPTPVHAVPAWLMFLSIIGLGGGVWLVRRR
jgi:hypothetical protein